MVHLRPASAQFGAVGLPAIAAVGEALDRKLDILLVRLGATAPPKM